MQNQFSALAEAISSHCARACEKARAQHLVARGLQVFVRSNPFRPDLPCYARSMDFRLINPTDDTRLITQIAKKCLKKLFRADVYYKKVGIMLIDLTEKSTAQMDLFHQRSEEELSGKDTLMAVMDAINSRYGSHTIKLAAEGCNKPWKMRSDMLSPCYTTRWFYLAVVE